MKKQAAVLHAPSSDVPRSVRQRFEELASTWREETRLFSSTTAIAMHPAYQQIIGMGPAVIPLLLRELEQNPDHWFWALKSITGEDPVSPEQRGRRKEMAQVWLQWGKERGYTW